MSRAPEDYAAAEAFEADVLAVARALFAPEKPFQGATILDARERDGIFIGEDAVVVVEATTSRSLEKAQKDGTKLKRACEELARQHRFKAIKGYFVTRDEPTAEQRRFIEALNAPVVACSLTQLRSLMIDSREYLTLRADHAFGSARNPATGSATELDKYVPIALLSDRAGASGSSFRVDDLVARAQSGLTTVILGDFGAGKSMTMREVHQRLASAHMKDGPKPFPLTLNLREHQGQREPDEAIRRHAAKIGFESPSKLVRAWRAGNVHVLLDGFDEIATTGWLGRAPNLAQIRRSSVELIRKFADQTPHDSGLIVSGRRHFFDTQDEMISSLGLRARQFEIAVTDQFSDEQVREYLVAYGWSEALPVWLPTHPLLLGYLATSGAFGKSQKGELESPDSGWDMLLGRICDRESQMEIGLDGPTIRRVLERLATLARTRTDGVGPLYQQDLTVAFAQVCGYPPDEGSYQVLQRMPGLGVQDAGDGSRFFIDGSLADAARAGDVARYAITQGSDDGLESVRGTAVVLGRLGVGVAANLASKASLSSAQANAVARRLQQKGAADALVFDLVRLGVELGASRPDVFEFCELDIDEFAFDDAHDDLANLKFRDCVVGRLDLTEYDGSAPLPYFEDCVFGVVEGAGASSALPPGHFTDCMFDSFDPSAKTTRGILAMPGLSPRQKVMLTILKKTFAQAGSGRRESSLYRGLDDQLRKFVPEVLEILVAKNMLVKGRLGGNTLYFPVRGQSARVKGIIETGAASADELVTTAR